MPRTPGFDLLAVSDRHGLPADGLPAWLRHLGAAGVGACQLREKDLDDRALYGLARLARSALPPRTLLLVNGRLDIALAAGAGGVHLPADGVPVAPLRARFGPGPWIGRSTHAVEEVERARDEGADYVTFGPVYATPGKEAYGPPAGLAALRRAAATGIPVFALGGITLERLAEVAGAGAAGAAGIRMFRDPAGLERLVRTARAAFAGRAAESKESTQ